MEVEVREGKLKNGKATGKNEATGEMIKSRGNRVVDWIWRLCNLAFESNVSARRLEVCDDCSTYKG